jgi:Icc-related predicted phosphoesterase
MRIGYVVDVHGAYERVDEALTVIGDVDLLIIGGDITTGGTPDEVARQIGRWRERVARLGALAGNMDSPEIDERLVDLGVALDATAVRIEDVGVFGVSAAPISPLRTPYELDDDELERRIERGFGKLAGARVVIFCPHAPPARTECDRLSSGEHVGSEVVRAFVERERPHLVLCGHIHEARAMDRVGGSRIVNPGPVANGHYAIVDIGDEEIAVTLDG